VSAQSGEDQNTLTKHDQFKGFDQNLRGTRGETEAAGSSLMSCPHEVEIVLIYQNNDTSFWSLIAHLSNYIEDTTSILAGLDQNQGSLLD
jgi:hypothetical protein